MPYAELYPVVSALLVVVIFIVTVTLLYKFVVWLWRRLPASVMTVGTQQLDRVLAFLVSLVLFPPLILYAWNVIAGLITFSRDFISNFAALSMPSSCDGPDATKCLNAISTNVVAFLSSAIARLLDALQLSKFPIESFVWFLIASVVASQIIGLVHDGLTSGRLQARMAAVPTRTRQRLAFASLLVVSFYLVLCALLAIPLFQDKTKSDQFTADSLVKAMSDEEMKPDDFDKAFPAALPSTAVAAAAFATPKQALNDQQKAFSQAVAVDAGLRQQMFTTLQHTWSAQRDLALRLQDQNRNDAKNIFAGGLEAGGGKQQTALYYYDLVRWHADNITSQQNFLRDCLRDIEQFQSTAVDTAAAAAAYLNGLSNDDPVRLAFQERQELFNSYAVANAACRGNVAAVPPVPQRRSLSQILGTVGSLTRWLLDTEQMPVVIIVGLVGFSLLGATVSRAVRAGDDKLATASSLDDLLIVIAGGTTAAVIVFLGAYGGLAILGNAAGDPNPYIVFATCLVGAVYSEDVWRWARDKLLQPATNSGQPANAANQGGSGNGQGALANEPGPPNGQPNANGATRQSADQAAKDTPPQNGDRTAPQQTTQADKDQAASALQSAT